MDLFGISLNLSAVVLGIIAGIGWALTGYVAEASKPVDQSPEDFQIYKFLRAVTIGAIIGIFSSALNLSFDQTYLLATQYGATAILEKMVLIAWRMIKKVEAQSVVATTA